MSPNEADVGWPFGRVALTLSLLGPGLLIAVLLWPGPAFDPDGVPSQVLGVVALLMYTAIALVVLALLGVLAGVLSLARREPRRSWVLAALALDGLMLFGALALLLPKP